MMGNYSSLQSCACGRRNAKLLFTSGPYFIVQCRSCGLVRTESESEKIRTQVYTEKDMQIYVQKEREFRKIFSRIIKFIQKYKKKGKFLEIGAGVGLLLSEAKKAKFTIVGFEPSRAGVKTARKHFNVRLVQSEFSKSKVTSPCDVVVLNHVLEHLPDPHRMIAACRSILAPGGILVIGVPNFGSFLAQAKKKKWQSLIPDQHRWHFTKKTLDSIVSMHGFKRVGRLTDNHDRVMHPRWKRPLYGVLDGFTQLTKNGEAILVAYKKS